MQISKVSTLSMDLLRQLVSQVDAKDLLQPVLLSLPLPLEDMEIMKANSLLMIYLTVRLKRIR